MIDLESIRSFARDVENHEREIGDEHGLAYRRAVLQEAIIAIGEAIENNDDSPLNEFAEIYMNLGQS
jgi:hypothetical protein